MGKGLETMLILELMIYASARLVNLALPLALLMSSIMTMGALAEHYELTAMKSAGIGLMRIMRPLTVAIVMIAVAAFYFSNNVWPIANLKFRTLLFSITQQKPTLNLDNGVFYNGIDGYSIRAMSKNDDTGILRDVIIYDHHDADMGAKTVIRAERGEMQQTDDKRYLLFTLYNGHSYDEQKEAKKKRSEKIYPHIRNTFEKQVLVIDLSSLNFNKADENLFKRAYEMMTIAQLDEATDSLKINIENRFDNLQKFGERNVFLMRDSLDISTVDLDSAQFYLSALSHNQTKRLFESAQDLCRANQRNITNVKKDIDARDRLRDKHLIEWHRKFFLSFSCVVLFFIGAPLGAIIRKGGMGWPTVWAIALFLLYYVLSIIGERMVKSGVLEPWQGMWISSLVLFPMSVFLTTKAANDSPIFDGDTYKKWFIKTFKRV